jgi:blue light- and temperature-responsive anti-repressor
MSHDLYRLAYCSQSRLDGTVAVIQAELGQILALSRRNNQAAGITGALMFNAGVFAQVLEGDRNLIEQTFERIQCDLRHAETMIMQFEPIEQRGFPDWSMGFVGRPQNDAVALSQVETGAGFDRESLKGDRIFQMLRELALEDEDDRLAYG